MCSTAVLQPLLCPIDTSSFSFFEKNPNIKKIGIPSMLRDSASDDVCGQYFSHSECLKGWENKNKTVTNKKNVGGGMGGGRGWGWR